MDASGVGAPLGLAGIPAGLQLAAALAGIDRQRLTGVELAEVLKAERRMSNHYMAASLDTMTELGIREVPIGPSSQWDGDPATLRRREHPGEFAADEPRAILHLTRHAAETELWTGWELRSAFPTVMDAHRDGTLDWARARLFPETLHNLTEEQLAIITERVLPAAPEQTTGELRARLRAEALAIDPTWHQRAYKERVQAALGP